MPAKGTRKINAKGKRPGTQMEIPNELYEEIERLASTHGLINPRNGKGNRTKLIELAVTAFKTFGRSYPDAMPYPQALIVEMEQAIAQGDDRWQPHLNYLYSWSVEQAQAEMADGVIEVKGGSYIV
jgi:hypothetical protein